MLDISLDDAPTDSELVPRYIATTLDSIEAELYRLKVVQLKTLCRSCKLNANHKKAGLIQLLTTYFNDQFKDPDMMVDKFACIKFVFDKLIKNEPVPLFQELITAKYFNRSLDTVSPKLRGGTGKTHIETSSKSPEKSSAKKNVMTSPYANTIHFEESPFYRLEKMIPESAQKIYVTNGRCTCTIKFHLSRDDFHKLQNDDRQKLYVLCGKVDMSGTKGNSFIQFPSPHEFQMNKQQVIANVKGIKNRPGTTKPADITRYLSKSNAENIFQFIYAFTPSEYILYIYIVKIIPPEEIVQQILSQPKIVKAATLYYLQQTINNDADDDLITTSTVMSLNCPISGTRMVNPVKSDKCKHIECFEALWFLHAQLQVPTWQCSICQIPIKVGNLAVSEFVKDILDHSNDDVDQVKLFPDGSWEPFFEENENDESDSDSDMDDKKDSGAQLGGSIKDTLKRGMETNKISSDKQNSQNGTTTPEPMIISLVSDDEESEEDLNLPPITNSNNSIIDNKEEQSDRLIETRSLDPKKISTTSFTAAQGSDENSQFLDELKARNTMLLEDISSNSGYSTPVRSITLESRHPSILNQQIKFPTYLQTNPFFNGDTESTSAKDIENNSTPAGTSSGQPRSTMIMQDLESQKPRRATGKVGFIPQTVENSNVTISHPVNDVDIPNEPDSMSMAMELTHNHDSGLDSPAEGSRIASVVHTNMGEDSQSIDPALPDVPILPTLPHLDLFSNFVERNAVQTQSDDSKEINEVSSMMKKPIVAPFQPRRIYSTSLPQKRQLSNSSQPPATAEY